MKPTIHLFEDGKLVGSFSTIGYAIMLMDVLLNPEMGLETYVIKDGREIILQRTPEDYRAIESL